ncbi:hypothetical protein BSP109_02881 [Brevibacterium sp. Mu109]|nr:hypothetical protein BSP109_02881 [Brevibacterium sp. Mu109]
MSHLPVNQSRVPRLRHEVEPDVHSSEKFPYARNFPSVYVIGSKDKSIRE